MAVPERVTSIEAAGIRELTRISVILNYFSHFLQSLAEAYLTAYQALVWNGRLQDKETVLIHAVRCKLVY